jgi:alpha-D-xyloside xylohydrolase
MNQFRVEDELKYKLMPYVYAQAKDCSERGLPMVRALFIEFPDDPGSWLVDNEYLFGSSILVAPLMHENETERSVYLPPGSWIDYQSGKNYTGGWQKIEAGAVPAVILVREGTVIPQMKPAQSTLQLDWSHVDLAVFANASGVASGLICLPSDNVLHEISLKKSGKTFSLANDPLAGKVTWNIRLNSKN